MLQAALTINLVIEQGRDLLRAKHLCAHGDWGDWLLVHFPKSHRTATDYMKLATIADLRGVEAFEECRRLVDAMHIAGILPEPERKQLEMPSISLPPVVRKLNDIAEWVGREADTVLTWEIERRMELRQRLRPVVDLYEKL